MAYAGAGFWDQFHSQRRESGDDLDWGGLWTRPFLAPLAEASGQTMHFFSEAYLRDLLSGWSEVQLVPVPVRHRKTGELFKQVWRGIARR